METHDGRRTILVVHAGAMGDVLLSLPAIRALRQAFPHSLIGLLAQGEISRLLLMCGEVQAVFPLEGQALIELWSEDQTLRPDLQVWITRCHLAICWIDDPDQRLHSKLRHHGVQHVIVRSARVSDPQGMHQEDRLLAGIKEAVPMGMGADNRKLALPDTALASGRAHLAAMGIVLDGLRRFAIVHPGSGSPHKCGDPALLAEVMAVCERQGGATPILVGGPADDDAVARVADLCRRRPLFLQHERLSIVAVALAHASLYVGYDSGLTHLAARLCPSTVALFGPTDSRLWAPRGPDVTVLTGGECRCEDWKTVQACQEKPCLRISSEAVICACERALQTRTLATSLMSDSLVMSKDLC